MPIITHYDRQRLEYAISKNGEQYVRITQRDWDESVQDFVDKDTVEISVYALLSMANHVRPWDGR